ncbi:MAG: phage tail protein [Mesorhizobium sp.]|uniref:phage tail protein n=1 Tax=unclassified Mesorhizobium TaxID=325217 RepID=UPI000F752922|nr:MULTISPECIES: tail fiber protein [unclassified Mesorhizobium]AZO57370.1 phage tail protein [Mesorhizobium sp. M8A.F.Ca.ET.057.01.1.1]RWE31983.1 MAG: phage tail protein [Mesorhizobium sp.]RWE42279.1 MAG: phage tail protein [Mesorhizobium sp.]
MSQPYVGEIRMFGGNFAPAGWMFCQGQLLPISENDTLFNLIGTTYGGDGQETFALPNLSGRIPIHAGQGPGMSQNYALGEAAGVESVTLTTSQIPAHGHALMASLNTASDPNPGGNVLATSPTISAYVVDVAGAGLAGNSLTTAGGSNPHDNFMPYLCVNFIISLFGVFPSQT